MNQTGSTLMAVIVASLVIGGISAVIMQQASQSQQYSRLARVKSAMFNAEAQIRSLAMEPSSYIGCDGQRPETCQFNTQLLQDYQAKVAGAKCAGGGNCGIIVVPGSATFDGATRQFNARIHYQGQELPLRDIEIQNLVIPHETLARSAALCPDTRPLFKGFVNGVPVCDPLIAQCPTNQWATRVNVDTLAVTCVPLPSSLSCGPGEYIASVSYSDTGIQRVCAPRADVYTFNNFTPRLAVGVTTTTQPPAPPRVNSTRNVYQVDLGCAPTLAECAARAGGPANCVASAEAIYRVVGGSGGTTYENRMCDVAWPGDLRGLSCSPVGSTRAVWDDCKYDRYGDVNWDWPYLLTNYECQVFEYCPITGPSSTTTTTMPPGTCSWSCMTAQSECSPGPSFGCGYAGFLTGSGSPDQRGQNCPNEAARYTFQRTDTGTCDVGWLDCDCTVPPVSSTTTTAAPTTTTTTTVPPPTTTTQPAGCPIAPKVDEYGGGQSTNCWTYTNTPRIPYGEDRDFMLYATTGTCTRNTSIMSCLETWACQTPGASAVMTYNGCDDVPTTTTTTRPPTTTTTMAASCGWQVIAWNPGGCGAQGGGGGGTVCAGDGVQGYQGAAACGMVLPCDAAHPGNVGLTYQTGYGERLDGYPDCDTTDYQCVCP